MAQPDFTSILNGLAKAIDDPIIAAWTIIGVVLVLKLPALIRESSRALREGRLNKVEVARQQALLKEELANRIARRRRLERRKGE